MKKTKLFLSSILLSGMLFISCGSEETTVEQNVETIAFSKTDEMLNFENALKTWMQFKKGDKLYTKQNPTLILETEKASKDLLVAIGKDEFIGKAELSTDELVRLTMKEYSKKLTEMYNQQKNH